MKDRRLFPRAVLIAFVGKNFLVFFLPGYFISTDPNFHKPSIVGPLRADGSCRLLWAWRNGKVGVDSYFTCGSDSDGGKCKGSISGRTVGLSAPYATAASSWWLRWLSPWFCLTHIQMIFSTPDFAAGPPDISLPHVPQPSQPVLRKDDWHSSKWGLMIIKITIAIINGVDNNNNNNNIPPQSSQSRGPCSAHWSSPSFSSSQNRCQHSPGSFK